MSRRFESSYLSNRSMGHSTAFQMTNYAMTPMTWKVGLQQQCPKNGQVQLRAHARAAFAS